MSAPDSTTAAPAPAPGSPGRRRQACDRCFRRKQKCDRLLPACTTCAELKLDCKARQWAFLDASAPDTLVINASVSEYVKSLEERLGSPAVVDSADTCLSPSKRRRLGSASRPSPGSSEVNVPNGSPAGAAGSDSLRRPGTDLTNGTPEGRANGQVSVRDTMGDISFLSRSAMAESRVRDDAFPRNLSLENMLSAATTLGGSDPARSVPVMAGLKQQSRLASTYRPALDRDSTQQYLDIFINKVAIKHLYLDKSDIMEDYDTVVNNESLVHGNVSRQLAFVYAHTCLVIAIGVLNSDDAADLSVLVTGLYSAAVSHLPTIAEAHGSLAMVHCMLTLAIFSQTCNSGGSTWHIIGLIMNQCISLSLHKEPDSEEVSAQDQQKRRNLFWSTYVLDRSIGIIMGRPFGIQDEEITVRTVNETEPPQNKSIEMSFKLYLVQYAKLISDVRSNQRRTPLFHYRNLYFWREAPAQVASLAAAHYHVSDFLDTLTCRAMVLLVRPDNRPGRTNSVAGPSPNETVASSNTPVTATYPFMTNDNAYAELEMEAMLCCKRFIDRNYEQSESRGKPDDGSFTNAYDLFTACVTFVYLARRRSSGGSIGPGRGGPSQTPSSSAITSGSSAGSPSNNGYAEAARVVIQKCSTLITILSLQFSSLRLFERSLLALSARLSDPMAVAEPCPIISTLIF